MYKVVKFEVCGTLSCVSDWVVTGVVYNVVKFELCGTLDSTKGVRLLVHMENGMVLTKEGLV